MKKTKKLLLFLITFVLTVATLTTSTAAWITLPKRVRVDNVEFSVIKDTKLQISFDGINYYDEINEEIINMYLQNQLYTTDFTSLDGIHFERLDGKDEGHLISFDFYFRAERSAADCIYLIDDVSNKYTYDEINDSVDGTYVVSQGIYWTPEVDFDNGYGDIVHRNEPRVYYGTNALRISFNEQNVTYADLRNKDERTNLSSFIFDPSHDPSRGFGMAFGAYDYFIKHCKRELTLPEEVPNTLYELTNFDKEAKIVNNSNSLVATMQLGYENNYPYKYAKCHVNIWLEGWDPDCIDGINKDIMRIQFKFVCADPA